MLSLFSVEFWVQFHDFPPWLMSEAMARQFVVFLGSFLDYKGSLDMGRVFAYYGPDSVRGNSNWMGCFVASSDEKRVLDGKPMATRTGQFNESKGG
ncbi:hypothetical protein Golob_014310 [Gossypium lobatum]|uniref:DUF4283 domain-containing protein n=1 Tax=Gossypium lobatum TaxID=34289 RepID=A0A7J8LXR1_9ROSI|nr:hypothetical protein [Gossypium lobatum]